MRPISLLYHDVISGDARASGFCSADADSYKLDQNNFARHLENIAGSAHERVQLICAGHDDASLKPVFLTFDDGGASADFPAARLLEARGWRGHFYIVTQRIGTPGFLSRAQIRDLHNRGHHIGSHSHSHPEKFSKLSYAEMLYEWQESRRILAQIVGQAPVSVSVPGGFYSEEVARAAYQAGYKVLFNSEPTSRIHQIDGLVILGRFGVKRNTSAETVQSLVRGDVLPRVRQSFVWNLKKPAKRLGGNAWFTIRRWLFARSASGSY